ncbi:hypothetical protein FC10_GL000290 [Lactobacillus delbrueckii subsp. lactis DSM 20072]|nr:hypothetical protein FC10_GL000290 [Lactobacillus delbrueckii subsp. lactis DSM 20072]MCT3500793.1 hypothetical protein [Lactobacillus delbrueckii subsp. lactis]
MNRKWAKKFKEAGIKIIFRAVTPTAENTREAIEAGVDVIIATGFDEGGKGHRDFCHLAIDR